MKRRTKGVLLAAGLAVAAAITSVDLLTEALARGIDPHHYCDTGFSRLVDCNYHWKSRTISQGTPIFTTPSNPASTAPSSSRDTPIYTDVTSWGVVECPQSAIARHLLCPAPAAGAPAQAASDDHDTGLPRLKPWLFTSAKNSTFIKAVHLETPLGLAETLRFYRAELGKRGWTENGGAVVEPDNAVVAFTTSDGPALLRLTRDDNKTIADLSLRKPAVTKPAMLPNPGQARLVLGNATDEEAVITINGQTVELAARVAHKLIDDPVTERKSPDAPEINLPPGKYKVALKIASGTTQNREFAVGADETWALVVGAAGVPIPLHLY